MSNTSPNQDPMEFLKGFWGNMGFPLPGMVTPTVDTDELGRRITDLKAVEGWLKTNLSMLQMTIQGLEMQRATLTAIQNMSHQTAASGDTGAGIPFANPALWPWNFMQSTATQSTTGNPGEEKPGAVAASAEKPQP